MGSKVRYRYHLVDESPWPFLVSTASLFLTLGAVLFFHFFVQGLDLCVAENYVTSVVSFMALAQKAKPKVLYLGGAVLANQLSTQYRNYSFRPIGIGNAKWNPNNYSPETQFMINEFFTHLKNKDIQQAYDVMYAILGNKYGLFSQNFGKVNSILNNMISAYNNQNPHHKIVEQDFFKKFGFEIKESELSFLDKTNRGTVMSNISEILVPKIVMNQNSNVLIERCFNSADKVNLSFQKNPEYTVGLFVRNESKELTLVIYDNDCKITEDVSLSQKMSDLVTNQNSNVTYLDKDNFGMNIVIVASRSRNNQNQNSDIIFNREQIDALVSSIYKLVDEYPDHFKNFDSKSENFIQFYRTGNASYLNKSNFPVVHHYRPIEFYNLPHDSQKFEQTPTYLTLISQVSKRDFIKNNSVNNIPLIDDDNTD